MINPDTFTAGHIRGIQQQGKQDPALVERTIFALGLLEAIARSGLPFIFKGGSVLLKNSQSVENTGQTAPQ